MPQKINQLLRLPNILTALNLLSGLGSIFGAIQGHYTSAALLLPLGAIFDILDGLVARKLHKESDFGAELDSLADLVTFGVAPLVLIMTYYHLTWLSIVALMIPFFGAMRLARHNVIREKIKGYLIGVPIDASAVVIPILIIARAPAVVTATLIIVMAVSYISTVRIKKPF